jgi:hypothetical protein
MMRPFRLVLTLLMLALAVPAAAIAAGAPRVTTDAATALSSTGATLNGTVNPNGNATTYYFEYGPTTAYGTKTAVVNAGSGNGPQPASQPVSGLTASTTSHFRLVATNAAGTDTGKDKAFTTLAPGQTGTGLSIAARSNPLVWGGATTISGQLTGARQIAGVAVTLRQNPYPYTGGFKTLASATTDAQGRYAFTRRPKLNTRYEVQARPRPGPNLTSQALQVRVRTKVTLRLSDATPARGQRVRFSGSVYPAHDGRLVSLQRRTSTGRYVTIARTRALHVLSGARSSFARTLRIVAGGTYRAYVGGHADHSAGFARRSIVVH